VVSDRWESRRHGVQAATTASAFAAAIRDEEKDTGMGQFRVMTWNVENPFDVGDEDGPETQAEFTARIESLRAVIGAQRPHVLALWEIGSESALGRLRPGPSAVAIARGVGTRSALRVLAWGDLLVAGRRLG
jgi:predicted extracellular nuclease